MTGAPGPILRSGHHDLEPMGREPVAVEALLHRERVPRSPTRPRPAVATAAAVVSAMCSNGTVSEAWTWSATLCMVLVHSSTMSAPADSRPRAASASSAAAASQLPAVAWPRSPRSPPSTARSAQSGARQPVADDLVREPVVERAALPAHAAEQPDGAHQLVPGMHVSVSWSAVGVHPGAGRVDQGLGAHGTGDPLAEHVHLDLGARRRDLDGQVRVGDRASTV